MIETEVTKEKVEAAASDVCAASTTVPSDVGDATISEGIANEGDFDYHQSKVDCEYSRWLISTTKTEAAFKEYMSSSREVWYANETVRRNIKEIEERFGTNLDKLNCDLEERHFSLRVRARGNGDWEIFYEGTGRIRAVIPHDFPRESVDNDADESEGESEGDESEGDHPAETTNNTTKEEATTDKNTLVVDYEKIFGWHRGHHTRKYSLSLMRKCNTPKALGEYLSTPREVWISQSLDVKCKESIVDRVQRIMTQKNIGTRLSMLNRDLSNRSSEYVVVSNDCGDYQLEDDMGHTVAVIPKSLEE